MATSVSEKESKKEDKLEKAVSFNPAAYFQEVKTEFLKISWPSKDQVTREFFSVLLLVSTLTGIIFLIDKALSIVLNFFNGRA